MNTKLKLALVLAGCAFATQAAAKITFYEDEGYGGRSFTTNRPLDNLERRGLNDRPGSAIVTDDRWEVCVDDGDRGRCVVLRPGRYPSLEDMGLDDRISSVRIAARRTHANDDRRYAPAPAPEPMPAYDSDYRRRDRERIYEAQVTSVHAVVGRAEQRCWVERQEVSQDSGPNVPGAVAGAIIGGILGHQVGGGRGKDVATVGGAVAGAAVGSNVGRDGQAHPQQDVQRCADRPSDARPSYWDVTYDFRGREHHVQLTAPPGETITVNEQGEPRA